MMFADTLGYMIGLSTILPLVIFFIIQLVRVCRGQTTFKELLSPTEHWGPQEVDGRIIDRANMQ